MAADSEFLVGLITKPIYNTVYLYSIIDDVSLALLTLPPTTARMFTAGHRAASRCCGVTTDCCRQ